MPTIDPLGLERCQSCGNAFAYDEQDDTCGVCGGPFRRRGRPRAGTPVEVRLPDDLLDAVDDLADDAGVSRAEMVRRLLTDALA